MTSQAEVIRFKNLDLIYPNGFHGLKDLNLSISQGEFIAIIGRSGAGKSTLLRAINRTVKASSGEAQVLGFDLLHMPHSKLKKLRSQIGFIFQQFNLVKNLSALENVKHGRLATVGLLRSLINFYPQKDVELAKESLAAVGLSTKLEARCDELSGGQQQRVAIARALVQQPQIILADEPMASLDPKLSEVVLDLLLKFNHERHMTTLVNMHVLDHARKYATRILGMREGQIVFDGPPSQLDQGALNSIYEGAQS